MSFTDKIKKELIQSNIKSKCCKKAFVGGIIYGSSVDKNNIVSMSFGNIDDDTILLLSKTIQSVIKKDPEIISQRNKTMFIIDTSSLYIIPDDFLKCSICSISFLRGVFLASAKINSPESSAYHAEFTIHNAQYAKIIYDHLTQKDLKPKIINRKSAIGLYYKNSVSIEELLVLLGAKNSAFELINNKIARTIRNEENRATNCVAKNISKTVSASKKQIDDINFLIKAGKLEAMPYDVRITANLRLENPEASLSELALLHRPQISKSGLNHRFQKISDEVNKIKQQKG